MLLTPIQWLLSIYYKDVDFSDTTEKRRVVGEILNRNLGATKKERESRIKELAFYLQIW